MSTGKTHARVTIALAIPAGVLTASILSGDSVNNLIMGSAGCLTGLVIEPDLDVDGVTQSEWKMIKRFWILGMLWVTLWYPYAWLIPHRSPLSHWPLLGTLGRVFYLMVIIAAVGSIAGHYIPVWDAVNHPLFIPWFVGLCIPDAAHFVMDVLSTKVKRMRR